jgi:hypothetical protein
LRIATAEQDVEIAKLEHFQAIVTLLFVYTVLIEYILLPKTAKRQFNIRNLADLIQNGSRNKTSSLRTQGMEANVD